MMRHQLPNMPTIERFGLIYGTSFLIHTTDSYKAYREKVQKYSEEESKVFENLRHGIVFGTKRYLNKITKKHLKNWSVEDLKNS